MTDRTDRIEPFRRKRAAKDFPPPSFYLVIVFKRETVVIPGDERSRTAPGHGYPEEHRQFETPEIYTYDTEESLEADVKRLYSHQHDIAVMHVDATYNVEAALRVTLRRLSP